MAPAFKGARLIVCTVLCASAIAERASAEPARTPAQLVREHRERELRAALTQVQKEQAGTTRLWPWAVLATGIALTAVGFAAGAGGALTCDDSCTDPFWPAWLVMGGATVATGGAIWMVLKEREIAELRSRRYRIETELQYLEWSAAPRAPTRSNPAYAAALGLRLAF